MLLMNELTLLLWSINEVNSSYRMLPPPSISQVNNKVVSFQWQMDLVCWYSVSGFCIYVHLCDWAAISVSLQWPCLVWCGSAGLAEPASVLLAFPRRVCSSEPPVLECLLKLTCRATCACRETSDLLFNSLLVVALFRYLCEAFHEF